MRLRVWLPPLSELRLDASVAFEVLDSDRRVQHRGEASPVGLPKNLPCELVLDPVDAVLLDVRLPRLSGARLAAALPGLVEERLIGSAEDVHVVATPRDTDGNAVAIAVDRSSLRRALDVFKKLGRTVVSVVPHMFAFSWQQGSWRARIRNGTGSVRSGQYSGFALEAHDDVPVEMTLCLKQAVVTPARLEVDGDCDPDRWSESLQMPVRQIPPEGQAPSPVVNLLQYQFAAGVAEWGQWRLPLILACVLLIVVLGGLNLHAWKLAKEEKSLRVRMSAVVTETIPSVTVVLDPLAQMRRSVADMKSGAGIDSKGFLALMVALGAIADVNSVNAFDYRDATLSVTFRDGIFESDEQRTALISRAADAGLSVRFTDTTSVNKATVRWKGAT